jgi:hypothetical protein
MRYRLGCLHDCGFVAEASSRRAAAARAADHVEGAHGRPVDRSELVPLAVPRPAGPRGVRGG